MTYLRVKNWSEFQHYKDRNPPWIKLHRALLDDYEFASLQDASKAHLMLIWLFASQRDGRIPNDPSFIKKKLGLEKEPNLKLFIDHGLLIPEQCASTSTEQDASKLRLESYKAPEEIVPAKPDISQPKSNGKGGHRPPRTVSTPTPSEFEVTEPMWAWAQEQGVAHMRVEPETAKFLDHHRAKGSAFKDWDAAWRTWMRKAVEFSARAH